MCRSSAKMLCGAPKPRKRRGGHTGRDRAAAHAHVRTVIRPGRVDGAAGQNDGRQCAVRQRRAVRTRPRQNQCRRRVVAHDRQRRFRAVRGSAVTNARTHDGAIPIQRRRIDRQRRSRCSGNAGGGSDVFKHRAVLTLPLIGDERVSGGRCHCEGRRQVLKHGLVGWLSADRDGCRRWQRLARADRGI